MRLLLTYKGYRESVCGGKSSRRGSGSHIYMAVRTVIATGEAAALTAGPECIKCGIGEEGSWYTWSVDGYQRAAGCLTAGLKTNSLSAVIL